MTRISIVFWGFLFLLSLPTAAGAVDGYSKTCGWCVAAGFWENVIRGNDKAAEYVDEGIKRMAMNLASEFRQELIKKCGKKYTDGDVETKFDYIPEPNASPQGHKVGLKGEAWTTCKRRKKTFLKENLEIHTVNRNGVWSVTDIQYTSKPTGQKP